ncbi:MAG: FAD:protein FMN transferase [Verrucomicrobiota bacterium]|nr:FAD:protein FMN transferase [Verrucomicrobiota bacterium]
MSAPNLSQFLTPTANGVRELKFKALGTECNIKIRLDSETQSLKFATDALEWIKNFEEKYSRYLDNSLVAIINSAAGQSWIEVDEDAERLLNVADEVFRKSDGVLDATMLPLARVWDWKKIHKQLPDEQQIQEALRLTGWDKVQRKSGKIFLPEKGMGIDFGGFGKELAVDALIEISRRHQIEDVLIDLGKDIYASGSNGKHNFWHIGIEDGKNPGNCLTSLAISDRAVSSSGTYARHFIHDGKRYGHIIDPRTGWPTSNGIDSVTVIAKTCLEAGIHSTVCYILGAEEGLNFSSKSHEIDVCIQSDQGIEGNPQFERWLAKESKDTEGKDMNLEND